MALVNKICDCRASMIASESFHSKPFCCLFANRPTRSEPLLCQICRAVKNCWPFYDQKLHSHQIITQWNMIHWNRRRRIWPFGTALGEGYWAMKQIQIPSLWRIAKTKTVENDHTKHEHGALPAATLESNLTFSTPYSTGNRITTKKGTQLYHNQLHESIANHHRCCWPCLWHLR